MTGGNTRFGAGTDSAPHLEDAKAALCRCSAGIFSAPNAVEWYATVFDEDDALEYLGPFLSLNFLKWYGMEPSQDTMTLVRMEHAVPRLGATPSFKGGDVVPWTLL